MLARETLDDASREIDELNNFLKKVEEGKFSEPVHPLLVNTLKASLFLLLYNAVEAITQRIREDISYAILDNSVRFDELSGRYQKELLKNVARQIDDTDQGLDKLRDVLAGSDVMADLRLPLPQGGNLGHEVLKRYAISLGISQTGANFHSSSSIDTLDELKKIRNQLAHGEVSFSALGRPRVASELRTFSDQIVTALQDLVSASERFIADERYRITP